MSHHAVLCPKSASAAGICAHLQDWEAAGGLRQNAISKFYLVDTSGHKTLAVSGEEDADGQYSYRSVPTLEQFGVLESKARRDVFSWLESIIEASKADGGVAVKDDRVEPAAEERAPELDEHLVFVRCQCASTLPAM